ncbi:MAG: transketolase C-terminal domain-containing protein [Patescibacteria group bacterium]
MLNRTKHLNPKLFDADVEKKYIRDGFGQGLLFAGEKNRKVVALSGDLSDSIRLTQFKERFPERYFEVGVAEQNLATVASGFAYYGKIPFMTSFAVFSPGRNWEQIRTTIALNNVPVKMIGSHAGIAVGEDGATHQSLEDIALMRVLPNVTVIVPCDYEEAKKTVHEIVEHNKPVYMRFDRSKVPVITTNDSPFKIGKAEILWDSSNPVVTIIAIGYLVHNALLCAKELEKEGIQILVVNNHTIKPMDEELILGVAKRTGAIVTVEDHQIAGGMGSAVAEFLAKTYPVPIEFVGVDNKFGQSGTPAELIKHYGLDVESIKKAVLKIIKRNQKPY